MCFCGVLSIITYSIQKARAILHKLCRIALAFHADERSMRHFLHFSFSQRLLRCAPGGLRFSPAGRPVPVKCRSPLQPLSGCAPEKAEVQDVLLPFSQLADGAAQGEFAEPAFHGVTVADLVEDIQRIPGFRIYWLVDRDRVADALQRHHDIFPFAPISSAISLTVGSFCSFAVSRSFACIAWYAISRSDRLTLIWLKSRRYRRSSPLIMGTQ